MPVTWDDAKEKQLLLLVLHFTQPPSPPWAEVAEGMGEGCSEEACKQKLKKLKVAAKQQFGEPSAVGNGTPKPKTPAKRGGRKPAGGTPLKSTGKRKAKKSFSEEEEEEEEEEEGSSSKETPQAKKLKLEAEDGADSED